ncbi:uncharacterized protein LOC125051881 [Pieris napi]|uniref:uncharacterized protein LOC125051881 n=1 Tax=Pieris napi TaxID=78633 RepID=UPI001FBA3CEB|nr:uncharacterized protein LOC125051881 [Pieris napi]
MKKSLHEKFRNKINFVKPLYRKKSDQVSNKIIPLDDRTLKLRGDDFDVNTVLRGSNVISVKNKVSKEYAVTLPGACDSVYVDVFKENNRRYLHPAQNKLANIELQGGVKYKNNDRTKTIDENRNSTKIMFYKTPERYLRVYPAPKIVDESTCSIIIRCVICQLGLTTFLILWTIIGVLIIQYFEGPHEVNFAMEFEKEQNQLVIDLATELRQITPLSPKWRLAIEKRMDDERKLTMAAVGNGAKPKSGQFWNLSGTFLFCVYTMTTLGFGAPVPHTIWGRTCAAIYGILAVPTHIYLMVNASTCVVVNVEACLQSLRKRNQKVSMDEKSPVNCRHFETSTPSNNIRRVISCCLGKCFMGRGLPVAICFYYLLGVVAFGVLRTNNIMDSLLFPLEFTTAGGLEFVESSARVLYGLYIEGAMCLLAYTLATIRRNGSDTVTDLAKNYRLLITD